MISNLHSLLNKPWYIEQGYAEAQLPLLLNILNGNIKEAPEKKQSILNERNGNSANSQEKQVAVLDIKSPIYKYNQFCGPTGTQGMMVLLDSIKNDSRIAGVVLDIDSGGGQVSGTPEFYDYLKDYPKPIVAYTGGYMCSAAYYIGSAADEVIANQRAEAIGSIGAYIQFLDLTGYYEKEGAKLHTIYASQSSEKNKAYRDALEGNYDAMIKEELDPIVDDFIDDMKAVRSDISNKVFKGATYNGPKALEMNLVDKLGTLNDAIERVIELSDEQNTNLNTTNMNTDRPNLQSVLSLDAPLASNENGVYLNDEQLDTVETTLADNATAMADAQTAQTTAEQNLTQEQGNVTALTTAVNELAQTAGVEPAETVAETITAINDRVVELGKAPGEVHTKTKKQQKTDANHSYIDFESPIYQN